MDNIVKWHSFWDPLVLMHPLRPLVNWYNGRIANNWIQNELQQRYETLKHDRQSVTVTNKRRAKSVLDLAIEGYIDSIRGATPPSLDPDFMRTATHQIRLFLFAGNDSTSSSIVFAFHLLSKNPRVLAQLHAEHDEVFGEDVSSTARLIKDDPSLLNRCKLTLAVVKETLRLYAPAATMRTGNRECFLTTRSGVSLPTNGCAILMSHHAMHRNARLWPRPEEFLPERWLVGPEHELFPQQGAWRPFELGPRNCIGQTLAMTEMKIVLAMTARRFEIKPAYEDFDEMKTMNDGWAKRLARGVGFGDKKTGMYRGDRAYQTEKAGAHPSGGYPCRVSALRR